MPFNTSVVSVIKKEKLSKLVTLKEKIVYDIFFVL